MYALNLNIKLFIKILTHFKIRQTFLNILYIVLYRNNLCFQILKSVPNSNFENDSNKFQLLNSLPHEISY